MRSTLLLAVVLVTACAASNPSTATQTASPTQPKIEIASPSAAEPMSGGCGMTAIYKGGRLPDWAEVNAPSDVPYVIGRNGLAVGYLFINPLRAQKENKILWYVGPPRNGSMLIATGHPLGASSPTVSFRSPANSFPGEIYPSGPAAPSKGCWHFTLTWQNGAHQDEVDLSFV